MQKPNVLILVMFLAVAGAVASVTAQRHSPAPPSRETVYIPSPSSVLGFTPGDDRKLASWNQVLTYFDELDKASDRVKFEALGKTTMDVPFVMATISAPENLAHLQEYKRIQDQLADPRKLGPMATRDRKAAQLIARGKTIVLITCGVHSTEVGSYLSSMLIAHRLATSNDPEILSILKNTIILLVPSLNPDGVDIVKKWYDKTLGTPYEGTSPPELYHKYVGHDNNRDWYMFTQVETQITVSKIHNVWHPQIVHDIHQQGEFGSRLFLPPYMAPVEPNVPKQIVEGYTELGNFMARELRSKGFQGITTNSTYDAWTPARAYSHYHGGVRILSETASAKIATPINVKFDQLRSREGYDPQKESEKFGPVWRGGEWKLGDITNYMTTAAFSLLRHTADNRAKWLSRFYEIGKEAVRPRNAGELWGYELLVKGDEYFPLEYTLASGGVEFESCESNNLISRFVRLAQPAGGYAKALLERQHYPNLRDTAGHPIAPYDVTAHTLSLLTNVDVRPVYAPFRCRPRSELHVEFLRPTYEAKTRVALYKSALPVMDEGWTRWVLENGNNVYRRYAVRQSARYTSLRDAEIRAGGLSRKYDTIVFPDQAARPLFNGYARGTMPEELTGGISPEGVKALREFVEQGGSLVFLNRASEFAIEHFKLPVKNVVAGHPRTEFYVPGSILRIELDESHPMSKGMPKETIAWAEDSPVFEVTDKSADVRVIAHYPTNANPLLSGWLLGGDRIKGQAALVEVKLGQGRIILFGFRPQYRAQSLATYPLFFNALSRK
jgi:hypothetical protein